jgi:sulfofructose kinase
VRTIAGVGVPTLDRTLATPTEPRFDDSLLVEAIGSGGGGQVATALVTCARLGCEAALIGAVGDDADGDAIRQGLRLDGVGTDEVVVRPGGRSASSVVLVAPDGSRSILYDPGRDVEPALASSACALVAGADGLLLERYSPASMEAARIARAAEATVLLDLDRHHGHAREMAPVCDVVIASEHYAAGRGAPPEAVVDELLAAGADEAVVTLGAEGAVGGSAAGRHREPAFAVDVVDTTGAGDVYHGAYLVARLDGAELVEAMRFAAVVAGLKCRRAGGRAGIPRRAEVDLALGAR